MLAFPLNLSYDTSSISQIGYVSIVRSLQHFIEQTSFHSLFELTQTNEYTKVHNMLYMSYVDRGSSYYVLWYISKLYTLVGESVFN